MLPISELVGRLSADEPCDACPVCASCTPQLLLTVLCCDASDAAEGCAAGMGCAAASSPPKGFPEGAVCNPGATLDGSNAEPSKAMRGGGAAGVEAAKASTIEGGVGSHRSIRLPMGSEGDVGAVEGAGDPPARPVSTWGCHRGTGCRGAGGALQGPRPTRRRYTTRCCQRTHTRVVV